MHCWGEQSVLVPECLSFSLTSGSAYPTLYIAHVTAEYFDQIWFLFRATNSHKCAAASSNVFSSPRFIEQRLTLRRKVKILKAVTATAFFHQVQKSVAIKDFPQTRSSTEHSPAHHADLPIKWRQTSSPPIRGLHGSHNSRLHFSWYQVAKQMSHPSVSCFCLFLIFGTKY